MAPLHQLVDCTDGVGGAAPRGSTSLSNDLHVASIGYCSLGVGRLDDLRSNKAIVGDRLLIVRTGVNRPAGVLCK